MKIPLPLIRFSNATFYRHSPLSTSTLPNPALFPNISLTIPSTPNEHWAILGPSLSGKTALLSALGGRLLATPPTSRAYPYLLSPKLPPRLRTPAIAIAHVGFDAEPSAASTSPYLSARYESRREDTDFSLRQYLLGIDSLAPLKPVDDSSNIPKDLLARVITDLRLESLLDLPVSFLSNGQSRRARIARALLTRPELLLLDEPFMGLDPPTVAAMSPLLGELAIRGAPRLILAARPQDPLPDWITHVVRLEGTCRVASLGPREEVLSNTTSHSSAAIPSSRPPTRVTPSTIQPKPSGDPIVEMSNIVVRYGDKTALGAWDGGLSWKVTRGSRWAVFGPNGSGKTTVVALLTSDHPQTYSLPIRLFGRSRLPEPGSGQLPLTFWDIQTRVGHSSPEVHGHFPRWLTLRSVLESAWARTFTAVPDMDDAARALVDEALCVFEKELNPEYTTEKGLSSTTAWADNYILGEASFSAQRVALLLRAVIKSPDVVVLDEAFSGMDDGTRAKCMKLLTEDSQDGGIGRLRGLQPHQALICISHIREEVPDSVREWMCLPEGNTGDKARFGQLEKALSHDEEGWRQIWDM